MESGGATYSGENLAVKQAVADGDGGVIILKIHTLFKGPARDRGILAGGGVYLNTFLKDAAGDGVVVGHSILEGAAGDSAPVVHIPQEGAVGDGAGVVVHLPLEGAAGDSGLIVGKTADGAAVKFGIFTNIEICLQCAYSPGLRRGLQGEGAVVQV